jgi:hypothetical protein
LSGIWLGIILAWLGWRIGILLPDLSRAELRSERAGHIKRHIIRVGSALAQPSTWVPCLFAVISVAAVDPLVAVYPDWMCISGGDSSHQSLSVTVSLGVLRGVAAVFGGWLGYHASRIAWRDEERRPNR